MFDRVFGVKPDRDAPKLDRLLWFQRYYLGNLALALPVLILLVFVVGTSVAGWIGLAITLPWLVGFTLPNLEIRRERRSRS